MEVERLTKNQKDEIDSLFYMPAKERNEEKDARKVAKEREKRIKENKRIREQENDFDIQTETVLNMTNKNNKQKQQKKQLEKDKNRRRLERRRKKIIKVVKIITLLAIIAGGITFALVSPIFNIVDIQVNNNNQVTTETIISLSEISQGQNIFKMILSDVEENIKENPYIEKVTVTRKFPNKIQIDVQERERDFSLEFLNGYAFINNQGYILEITEEKNNLPVLQGASTPEEQIVPGNRLQQEDLERLEVAIGIMESCTNCELDTKVTSIDISDKTQYSIYMQEELKTIYLGDATNLSDRILWVQAILKDNEGLEGDIYVDGDLNNKFKPRFREKL